MALKLVFVFALCLAAVHSAQDRIVGGTITSIEQHPSLVQVDFRFAVIWGQSCAANILNTRYVLSAAHCFRGILVSVNNRRIRAGTSTRNSGGIVIGIERIINHPSYRRGSYDGDISVIRLSSALEYSNVIQQIGIPPAGYQVPDNAPVVHAGWGAIYTQGPSSPQLRNVEIYTINRELCRQRYAPRRMVVTENMICAGIQDVGGRDACQGDSGGPMYLGNLLIGIVSWGRNCAEPFYPGVSAAVSSYTDWIVANAV